MEFNTIDKNTVGSWMRHRYAIALVVMVVACAALVYGIATFDICETEVVRTISSPKGDKNLIVFHRNCGATVDFNTQVSVLPSGMAFSFDRFPAFFSSSGKDNLNVTWRSNAQIEIVRPSAERIYRQDGKVGDVTIVYR